jgi:outer membrane protein assembly factor BamB
MNRLRFCFLLLVSLISVAPVYSQSDKGRCLLLRDEGMSQLSYVDMENPGANWYAKVPPGRDLQLIGDGRFLIGTGNGYEEREIKTGNKVFEQTSFEGTISARRLRNGNTLLIGLNWQGKEGIVLIEVDEAGTIHRTIIYPGFPYVRLARETAKGTFLITSDSLVFEGDANGSVIWKAKIESKRRPHSWQALRLADGRTVVSSGYAGNLQVFDAGGTLIKTISGPEEVHPNFYAGLQILPNGDMVVANWQGHGPTHGASGMQVLEYAPDGKLVWSWKQDPAKYSSLQGVIILNGLDLKLMHIEDANGVLAPVK